MQATRTALMILVTGLMLTGCENGFFNDDEPPKEDPQKNDLDLYEGILVGSAFTFETQTIPWNRCWSQYQGNPEGSGHLFIGSDRVGPIRFRTNVGQVINATPVIGPDGTIYIGTAMGELVAVAPDGRERWRRNFFADASILSTPAIAPDGTIFVIYQQRDDDGNPVSTLNRVAPDGSWLWATLVGDTVGFTSASPKVLGDYVYIVASTPYPELLVFDFDANIVARDSITHCTPVCGSFDWGGLWDSITDFSSDACCVAAPIALPFCAISLGCQFDGGAGIPAPPRYEMMEDPSVAVTDMRGLVDDDGNPLVIVLNGYCMTAYRFKAPELDFLWQRQVYGGGCDDDPVRHASPAILANGLLVICNEKGKVKSFDPLTGDRLWTYDAGEPVRAPATSLGRQVYVVSENYAHFLEYDGEQLDAMPLSAPTGFAPVISGSYVYAVTSETVHSLDLDFSSRTTDHRVGGGVSSPAIGPDGELYVVTDGGELIAYGDPIDIPGTVGPIGDNDQVAAP